MSRPDALSERHQQLLKEAADWLVRLDEGELSPGEQHALNTWVERSADHRLVWQKACELADQFTRVPTDVAKPVLHREQRLSRRGMLKSVMGAGVVLPLGWLVVSQVPAWSADFRTATGERRRVTLADGSELMLNTQTAVDVVITDQQRRMHVHQGEIFIRTAPEPRHALSVVTAQGHVDALGTAFAVRCLDDATLVSVESGAVVVTPAVGQVERRIAQEEQCRFSQEQIQAVGPVPPDALSWRRGALIAENWRLADFCEELSRYRLGILRCASDVADLKISGVFQVDNTNQALEVLAQVFHLKIHRMTDYWVSITAA